MKINSNLSICSQSLPGYKLVGYSEVLTPIFVRKLTCLSVTKKPIPVVEEFILNFYNEGLSFDEIGNALGLDNEIMNSAIAGLYYRGFINTFTKEISFAGKEYLNNFSVNHYLHEEFSICVDGLNGEIISFDNQYINKKIAQERNMYTLRNTISKPNILDVDFKKVKSLYKKMKSKDTIDDEIESENELIEIIGLKGSETKYNRAFISIFQNCDDDVRVIVIDGANKNDGYEDSVLRIDNNGFGILYPYPIEFYKWASKSILSKYDSLDYHLIEYLDVNKSIDTYMEQTNSTIELVLPLEINDVVNESLIECIETRIKQKLHTHLIISGQCYSSETQKSCLKKIIKFSEKNKGLTIEHTKERLNKGIFNSNSKSGLLFLYEVNEINLSATKNGVVEFCYSITNNAFEDLYLKIKTSVENGNLLVTNNVDFNLDVLKNKNTQLIQLTKDLNKHMHDNDGIGWYGNGQIPEFNRISALPLAKSEEKFKVFIDILHKSLVESLENASKGKREDKYFWNGLKNTYPELQRILDKIRTYRNWVSHLKLNDSVQQKFIKYLDEDTNGKLPEFIPNGHHHLQYVILNELISSIRISLEK